MLFILCIDGKAHGSAGPEFIKRIMGEENLRGELDKMDQFFEEECPNNIHSHISSVAVVGIADYYMHKYM